MPLIIEFHRCAADTRSAFQRLITGARNARHRGQLPRCVAVKAFLFVDAASATATRQYDFPRCRPFWHAGCAATNETLSRHIVASLAGAPHHICRCHALGKGADIFLRRARRPPLLVA